MRCRRSDCFDCSYPDCINDHVPKLRRRTAEQKERLNAWYRQRREKRREAGLCPYCGKRPPDPGYKTCGQCRACFRRKRTENKHRSGVVPRSIMDGVERCAVCGRARPADGYRLCQRCLDNARRALDKAPTHNGGRPAEGWKERRR